MTMTPLDGDFAELLLSSHLRLVGEPLWLLAHDTLADP